MEMMTMRIVEFSGNLETGFASDRAPKEPDDPVAKPPTLLRIMRKMRRSNNARRPRARGKLPCASAD
jgi:hypothetical protein